MSTAERRRAFTGPPLLTYGFRPFFLFGALWGAAVVPLWLWSLLAGGPAAFTRDWHVHEMLFGFLAAIVAGFLTTSVPNWTGRMPVVGAPLAGLVILWAAGRLAMLLAGVLGPWSKAVDSLFLIVFAAVIWREILAGRNWRNLPVALLLTVLAAANVAFHAGGGVSPVGERAALAVGSVLIALIGGRIVPSFTRNWMKARDLAPQPAGFGLVDRTALALTVGGTIAWTVLPAAPISGALLLLAGAALAARLARWQGWRTIAEPLVWILHLGYGWLALALALTGAAALWPGTVPRTAALHALTVGGVGVMTLAVMTRASRGHTGRPLRADRWTTGLYLLINLAAFLRVAAPFTGEAQPALLAASAGLWTLAFGGFAAVYGRMLTTRRPASA